jgi:hypothetical protein
MPQFTDSEFRPCMECHNPANPKPVISGGLGAEVRKKETGEVVGYLHANCKAAWIEKHGEDSFSFRRF